MGHGPSREFAEQFDPLERVGVIVTDRLNRYDPARAGERVVFTDADGKPRTIRTGASRFGEQFPVLSDDEVGTPLIVCRLRRIKGPGARQQIPRIRDGRDRNDPFDGGQQADPGLLGNTLAVMLEIALDAQAVGHSPVRSHAGKVSVSAHVTNTVFQMCVGHIDAQSSLFFGQEAATEIDGRAKLPKRVAGYSEGRDIEVARPLGHLVDDAGRTGNAEHQCVGAFERLDALLVFVGGGNDAGDRQSTIQTVV